MGLTGKTLAKRRLAAGVRQAEVARYIIRADGSGKPIDDTLLSRIETRQIRLPRGFAAEYLHALEIARQRKLDGGQGDGE